MLNLPIIQVHRHVGIKGGKYTLAAASLGLHAKGLKYLQVNHRIWKDTGPIITFLPAGVTVELQTHKTRSSYNVQVGDQALDGLDDHGEMQMQAMGCSMSIPMLTHLSPLALKLFLSDFQTMYEAFQSSVNLQRLRLGSAFAQCLYRLAAFHQVEETQGPAHRLKWHIDQHLEKPLELERIAKICQISSRCLREHFTRSFGCSPTIYRNDQRMKLALKMLEKGNANISEIAKVLEYQHVQHFSRCFKKHFGAAPTHVSL